jgi:hypothetical protein
MGRIARWRLWRRLVGALLVGFAMGTGLHVGRPFMPTPYTVVYVDDSEVEIPWEWVPGLIIDPQREAPPVEAVRVDQGPRTRFRRAAELLRRIGLTRFSETGPGGLGASPALAAI